MPQGIEIRSLDDVPGMASQRTNPGMQIQPLTPSPQAPMEMDISSITPAYDPSAAVQSLNQIVKSQQEQIAASADALRKNTIVSQQVYDENVKAQDETLSAYDRLQRISRNPLADLFAVFDPRTWSKKHQLLDIEKSQLKAQSVTMRGQAQININNQLPALKATEVSLAQAGFENQKALFGVVKDVSELNQKEVQLRINAAHLRIAMSTEERQQVETAAKSLSTDQARALLKAAKSGKPAGIWNGREGILEDIIDRAEKRDLDAANIRLSMKNQQFDLAEKQLNSFVNKIDFTTGSQLVEQALASNSSTVNYGGVQIPLATMILGMEKVRKDTEAFEQAALANSAYGMNETLQTVVKQNSALALSNPKAAQNLQVIQQFASSTNMQDPQQLRRLGVFLNDMKAKTAELGKQAAATYKTPEAKAGMQEFIDTGAFTPQGGQAVATEVIGNAGVMARSRFPAAWNATNMEIARRVNQLNIDGAPSFDGSNNSAQQMMTYFLINRNKKVEDIKAEVIASGFGNDVIANEVTKTYRGDAMKNVLDSLSTTGPNAQTFLNLVRSPQTYVSEDGRVDAKTLATYLAQQTVLTGNKVDYTSAFLDALKTYGTNSDSITADPGMTAEDQALLSKSFGGDPRRNIISEFISEMATQSTIMNRAMQDAIKQDVTGETQRSAIRNINPELQSSPELVRQYVSGTPSATGIGTAEEIKAIYGTDPRFGGAIQPKGNK